MLQELPYKSFVSATFNKLGELLSNAPFPSEVDFSNDVLSWKVASVGEYVFNKQPPMKQLWVSSPITGPARFEMRSGSWIHTKNRKPLSDFLAEEMQEIKKRCGIAHLGGLVRTQGK